MFYPDNPGALLHDIKAFLRQVKPADLIPKAIIVPHAGYIYSGPVAASAYALLHPLADRIHRVVLLGPVHRVWVNWLALPDADYFETPLGRIEIDAEAIQQLSHLNFVEHNPDAHAQEHSIEVQLPFLQTVLDQFKLVPLVVGGALPEQVAQVLDMLWGGEETLIVISSDLSHYQSYDKAQHTDQMTIDSILQLNGRLIGEQACGAHPINGLLLAAKRHGLVAHLLDLRNSGDTAGDRQRVVGYTAMAFTETTHGH
jgi:hypothetical protein